MRRALVAVCLWCGVASAAPRVINRVVAVVDDVPITLRDVDRRLPGIPAAEKAAARKAMLDSLIDAQLIQRAADQIRMSVEVETVDAAITEIGKQAGFTMKEVFVEAAKQGFDETAYRREVGQQILAIRMTQWWTAEQVSKGGPALSGAEARAKFVAELRANAYVEVKL